MMPSVEQNGVFYTCNARRQPQKHVMLGPSSAEEFMTAIRCVLRFHYRLPSYVALCASFVSHTWARDRRDQMFRNSTDFIGSKAVELKEVLEDIVAEKRAAERTDSSWSHLDEMLMKVPIKPLDLWIDKVCGGNIEV